MAEGGIVVVLLYSRTVCLVVLLYSRTVCVLRLYISIRTGKVLAFHEPRGGDVLS